MSTEEKSHSFLSYIESARIFFSVALFLILPFFLIGEFVYPDERDSAYADYIVFETDWYQVMENGDKIPVDVPGTVPAKWGEVVTLTTTLPEYVYNRETICFRTIWQDVEIYIDGKLRQSYNTKDSRPFGTNSAFRYVFVELYEADAGKELTYKFSSNSKYAGVTRTCYIGDRASIWMYLVSESGARTVIALFLLLLSFFCIVVCQILKLVYKMKLPLYYLAWTIFFGALWMLSEIEFRQIIFRNVSVLTNYTYWSLMLIPFPLLLYMNIIQERRYEKVYFGPIVYNALVLIVGTALQLFEVVQFVQQLPFIHLATAMAILCIMVTIVMDVAKKKISDYLAVGIGLCGLMFAAIVEIILYYVGTSISLGTVLAVGLLFFLIMAIVKTGQDFFQTEQKKQQAIMAKDAQAKFLASMSHEIRTPINAVIGMNEMILRENDNETIQEYATNIQRASNMLLELVNEVLDFSKVESGKLELVEESYDFASLIQDEILLLNARAQGKPISVQVDIDSKLPSKLWGDELRLKQVLTNLLSNAVKYTKEGKVTFRAFFQWIDSENINLGFSVSDTGVGIKEEDLDHLFESFKRLELNKNRNIEGTGLGLNIVKGLVELMQGNIYVKSEYGKGSTFSIFIPQKVMDKEPIGNFEEISRKQEEKKHKRDGFVVAPDAQILVVDDNSMNLTVIKELLKRTEMKMDFAKSGKECLEYTRQKHYDMILLDHMMPEMDGIETLKKLRGETFNPNQNTVVVALTANAVSGSREMYLANGFNDYLSKPIQVDVLDEMLFTYLPEDLIQKDIPESDLFYVDRNTGLYYCKNSESFYKEILALCCEECMNYVALLENYFAEQEWQRYSNIAYELKTNALNIGAANFSKLSQKYEIAAAQGDVDLLKAEHAKFIRAIKDFVKVIENM